MTKAAIILVNWNGWRDTVECLESLLRLEDGDFRVVIVDNGSRDGSIDAIRAWADGVLPTLDGPPWPLLPVRPRREPSLRIATVAELQADPSPGDALVTLIDTGVNLGFAGANNVGMAFAARDRSVGWLWLLNNDTVAAPDSLTQLRAHAHRHPDCGLIGAALIYYHDPALVQGLGGWMRPSRARAGHIGFGLPADALPPGAEVDASLAYVMGASMFLPRAVFEATGGMSEAYFLYWEEPDWARRLPAGLRQTTCLDARVYHKEGGSIGTSSIARPSDTSLYYQSVNGIRFYWKYERRHLPVYLARMGWDALHYARRGDGKALSVLARAGIDALAGRRRRGPWKGTEW